MEEGQSFRLHGLIIILVVGSSVVQTILRMVIGILDGLIHHLCPRARQIIPRLLRKLDVYRGREKLFWACIIVSWLITIRVILICLVSYIVNPKL